MTDPRFFTSSGPFTLEMLAHISGATLSGEAHAAMLIEGPAPLDQAGAEHISFLSNKKYSADFKTSKAGACVVEPAYAALAPEGMALLITSNPYAAFARIATAFFPAETSSSTIAPTAIIDETALIGDNCTIGAYAVIGPQVQIGEGSIIGAHTVIDKSVIIGNDCIIRSHVTLSHTIIGHHVLIHPGVSVGQDGFGFAFDKGQHVKVPQLGRVIIGNHVEIGAGSCIDRGAGPDTIIGDGCKIDNLVQIGHNVVLGRGCIIVAQVGIAGSTQLGDFVVVGGQVGIAGHLTIGSGTQIAAQSGVAHNLAPGEKVGGSPAMPIRDWHRQTLLLKHLTKNKKATQ